MHLNMCLQTYVCSIATEISTTRNTQPRGVHLFHPRPATTHVWNGLSLLCPELTISLWLCRKGYNRETSYLYYLTTFYPCVPIHIYRNTHSHTHMCEHTYMLTRTQAYSHMHTCTQAYSHTCACTHSFSPTGTHMHTHTHAHKHTKKREMLKQMLN